MAVRMAMTETVDIADSAHRTKSVKSRLTRFSDWQCSDDDTSKSFIRVRAIA